MIFFFLFLFVPPFKSTTSCSMYRSRFDCISFNAPSEVRFLFLLFSSSSLKFFDAFSFPSSSTSSIVASSFSSSSSSSPSSSSYPSTALKLNPPKTIFFLLLFPRRNSRTFKPSVGIIFKNRYRINGFFCISMKTFL